MKENKMITTTASRTPLISHRALSDGVVVFHNSPDNKNVCGGNIIVEPISDLLDNREFKKEKIIYTNNNLLDYAYKHRFDKFDYLKNNCEDFAFGFFDKRKSPQRVSILVFISIFFLSIIKR